MRKLFLSYVYGEICLNKLN